MSMSMSLCVDSHELESSHETITFSELVAFPSAVHAKLKITLTFYRKNIVGFFGTTAIFIPA